MNLQFLQYALEVERTGSITQAAENLYMNQPHLSRAIRDLEKDMGFMIFDRTSRGIVPTKEGEEFLHHAKEVMVKVKELEKLRDKSQREHLRFSFAAVRGAYIREAFKRLTAESGDHSVYAYYFHETGAREVIKCVTEKQCGLGVTRYPAAHEAYYQKLLRERNLVCHNLAALQYHVLISQDHPLANREYLTYLNLVEYPEVFYGDEIVSAIGMEDMDGEKRQIYVWDRDTAHEVLSRVPGAYMWTADSSKIVCSSHGLVLKKCSRPGNDYRDVAISMQGYLPSEKEKRFLELLSEEALKVKL